MTDLRTEETPSAPQPPTAQVGDLSQLIRPATALAAVQLAGLAYAFTWAAAFVLLILAKITDSPVNPFTGAFQLVPTSAGASFHLPMGVGLHLSILSVFAVTAAASVFWVRRTGQIWSEAASGERIVAAVVAGVTYSAIATLASALFPVKIGLDALGSDALDTFSDFINVDGPSFKIHAASVGGFFIAAAVTAVLVAVVVALSTPGRSAQSAAMPPTGAFLKQMKTAGLLLTRHATVVSVLTVVALVIFDLFGSPSFSDLFAIPLLLGNVLVYALSLGHLSGAEVSYDVHGGYSFFQGGGSDSTTATVFTDGAGMWPIVGFVAVLVIFVLGAVVSIRRFPASNLRSDVGRNIAASALVWAMFGGALSILGRISVKGAADLGEAHGDVHLAIAPAAWTFLVFAVWGAAFEAIRVFVAPSLAPALPEVNVRGFRAPSGSAAPLGGPTPPPPPYAPGTQPAPQAPTAVTGPSTVQQVTITKKQLAIGAGAVAVLAVAWGTYSVANSVLFGAKSEAGNVASAFDSGDTSQVASLLQEASSSTKANDFVLLDDAVFDKAKPEGYEVSVKDVKVDGDTAHATLKVRTNSSSWPMSVDLEKDGHKLGIFDKWKVTKAEVPTLDADLSSLAAGLALTVNGRKVDSTKLQTDNGLFVLPGNYTFHIAGNAKYTTFPDVSFTVDGDGSHQTSGANEDGNTFAPTLTSDAQQATSSEVSRIVDECVSAKMEEISEDVSCPSPDWYGVDNQKFTIVSQPTLSYSYQGLDDAGNPTFSVETDNAGEIDGTGTGYFGDETTTVDVSPQGTITVQGDTLNYAWDTMEGYGW